MQQFTVPQFIDVEDKIIGPITARQFVIMLCGFLLIGICYRLFSFTAFVMIGLLIFGIFGTFAFLKINGVPFHFFVLNFMQTSRRPRLRVWNKEFQKDLLVQEEKETHISEVPAFEPRHYTASRLAELSLIVDTQGVYQGELDQDTNIKSGRIEEDSKKDKNKMELVT